MSRFSCVTIHLSDHVLSVDIWLAAPLRLWAMLGDRLLNDFYGVTVGDHSFGYSTVQPLLQLRVTGCYCR